MPLIFHWGNTFSCYLLSSFPLNVSPRCIHVIPFCWICFTGNFTCEQSDVAPVVVSARVPCAASNHIGFSSALCTLPLYMLYCNEATSVNCSEGWLLHRDDNYTSGSICARLFFLLLLLLPIFFTLLLPNLLLATGAPPRESWGTLQASFFSLRHVPITVLFQTQISWWLCGFYWCYFSLLTSFLMFLIFIFLEEQIYSE